MSFLSWMLWSPLLPGLNTAVNLLTWHRPTLKTNPRAEGSPVRVSVLIPARNESKRLPAVLDALAKQELPQLEIVVYDDQSTDGTADLLAEYATRMPQLRWIRGDTLPEGWVGKPHACHRLAQEARGELFFFLDADVHLEAGALAALRSFFEEKQADVLSLVPRQELGSFAERLVVPLLLVTYVSWFPLRLVSWGRDPRLVAANGQMLLVRRESYERWGGFAAVKSALVDDVAFCRLAKQRGEKVIFADGTLVARCRMYESWRQVWEGFSKNLFEGLGSVASLFVACSLYFFCFVFPVLVLGLSLVLRDAELMRVSSLAVGALLLQRVLLIWRYKQPWEGLLLFPVSTLALLAIAFNSWRWHRTHQVRWANRVYAGHAVRSAASEAQLVSNSAFVEQVRD